MTSVAEVLSLYERWGGHNYDEDLAQAEHGLQTAAHAEAAGASDALVAAALLHDVGHLLALDGQSPARGHEQTGARYLAQLFPPEVTSPVALHVPAKRYLCAVDGGYAATLSAGSTRSLARQGGPMSRAEVIAFETTPGWADAVALRRWDDAGKAAVASSRSIDSYRPLLVRAAAAPRLRSP
jgi:gamma-butyrobetaine dioxygenase